MKLNLFSWACTVVSTVVSTSPEGCGVESPNPIPGGSGFSEFACCSIAPHDYSLDRPASSHSAKASIWRIRGPLAVNGCLSLYARSWGLIQTYLIQGSWDSSLARSLERMEFFNAAFNQSGHIWVLIHKVPIYIFFMWYFMLLLSNIYSHWFLLYKIHRQTNIPLWFKSRKYFFYTA